MRMNLTLECSHPVHPATVHLPIAFLMVSYGLDIVSYGVQNFPEIGGHLMTLISNADAGSDFETRVKAAPQLLNVLTHVTTLAGIVTGLPALSSGVVELYYMVSSPLLRRYIRHSSCAVYFPYRDALPSLVTKLLTQANQILIPRPVPSQRPTIPENQGDVAPCRSERPRHCWCYLQLVQSP